MARETWENAQVMQEKAENVHVLAELGCTGSPNPVVNATF